MNSASGDKKGIDIRYLNRLEAHLNNFAKPLSFEEFVAIEMPFASHYDRHFGFGAQGDPYEHPSEPGAAGN